MPKRALAQQRMVYGGQVTGALGFGPSPVLWGPLPPCAGVGQGPGAEAASSPSPAHELSLSLFAASDGTAVSQTGYCSGRGGSGKLHVSTITGAFVHVRQGTKQSTKLYKRHSNCRTAADGTITPHRVLSHFVCSRVQLQQQWRAVEGLQPMPYDVPSACRPIEERQMFIR